MLLVDLFKGIAVGIVIAVPVGPVGVLCIRRTVFEGPLAGFLSGLGAATADTIFGIIAGFGLTFVANLLLGYQDWLRAVGGGFLVYVGLAALGKRIERLEKPPKGTENLFGAYLSTFVLTITNPVTIIAFLGIFAAIGFTGEEATFARAGILVAGVLAGSLLWWIGLCLGAGWFRKSVRPLHLLWLNRISGTILALSGLALLASLAWNFA